MKSTSIQTCASSSWEQTTVDIDQIKDAIAKIPAEPIAEWMRSHGFDPENGCLLLLPKSLYQQAKFGEFGPPSYVRENRISYAPILFNPNSGSMIVISHDESAREGNPTP